VHLFWLCIRQHSLAADPPAALPPPAADSQQLFKVVLPRWKQYCARFNVPIRMAPAQAMLLGSDESLYRSQWYGLHNRRKQYNLYTQDAAVQQVLQQLDCMELRVTAAGGHSLAPLCCRTACLFQLCMLQ
jgi:hypothetical protein